MAGKKKLFKSLEEEVALFLYHRISENFEKIAQKYLLCKNEEGDNQE